MNPQTAELLYQIGENLDLGMFPSVSDGGLVWPARADVVFQPPGLEIQNGQTPSASQSWQTGAPGAPGASGASSTPLPAAPGTAGAAWTAGATPSISCRVHGLAEWVRALAAAYPGTEAAETREALWLRVPASLLPRLGYRAVFVIALLPGRGIERGWAFWDHGIWGLQGIGPRHTNYGDASICAYDSRDGTWNYGDPLVALLDLFAVWAVRHLFFSQFGRWPGPQASFSPFERLREYRDDEHCGCAAPKGRYADCCKLGDLRLVTGAISEVLSQALMPRAIPAAVCSFANDMIPPHITYDGVFPTFLMSRGGIANRNPSMTRQVVRDPVGYYSNYTQKSAADPPRR